MSAWDKKRGYKHFRDPIYGLIEVPLWAGALIDHPLFQRLRWINQLALEQMVYPGAVHSRFEHSIGTMFLAGLAAKSLLEFATENKQLVEAKRLLDNTSTEESQKDFVKAAMALGLLHDVGHGPLSHVLEEALKGTDQEYSHERVGYQVASELLKPLGKEAQWVSWVKEALNKGEKKIGHIGSLLRSLIDGPIDVDKGDYLMRDSYHCGVPYGQYGHTRLWMNLAIIPDGETIKIGVTEKGATEAYHMLIARYHMYEAVYEHHARIKVDAMLRLVIRMVIEELQKPSILPRLKEGGLELDKDNLGFFQRWNDGFLISGLHEDSSKLLHGGENKRGKAIIMAKLLENIWKRNLPKESQILTKKEISLDKDARAGVLSDIHSLADKINEKELVAIPFAQERREAFPIEPIGKIFVFKSSNGPQKTIPLFEFLKLKEEWKPKPTDQESKDEDAKVPMPNTILKMFVYDEEKNRKHLERFKDRWDEIENKKRREAL